MHLRRYDLGSYDELLWFVNVYLNVLRIQKEIQT